MQNKVVILDRMIIQNFRKIQYLDISFNEILSTVKGPNGIGKSTIASAWYWQWTGYDMFEQNEFEVKYKNEDGKTTDRLVVSVESFIRDGDISLSLRKEQHEVWGAKSEDDEEEVFKENVFKYFINGVEQETKKAFVARLNEIVPMEDFRIMTNPHGYFLMKEQAVQRQILLNLVGGDISDEDLLAVKPEYADLIKQTKSNKIETIKKEVEQSIKAATAQKKALPKLIEAEVKHMKNLPSVAEFEETEKELTLKKDALAKIDEQLLKTTTEKDAEKEDERKTMLQSLKADLARYIIKFHDDQQIKEQENDTKKIPLNGKIKANNANITESEKQIALKGNQITALTNDLKKLTEEWHKVDQRPFVPLVMPDEDEPMPVCEACGSVYSREKWQEKINTAQEDFNTTSVADKEKIKVAGTPKNEQRAKLREEIAEAEAKIVELKADNEKVQAKIDELVFEKKKIEEDPDHIALTADIAQREAALASKEEDAEGEEAEQDPTEDLIQGKALLVDAIEELNRFLGKKDIRDAHVKEKARLEAEVTQVNKTVNVKKKELALIIAYLKDRSTILEEKVNAMFEHIKFELFSFKNDGTPLLESNPTYKGVYYKVVNTAFRPICQIDVVNTFTKKCGVSMPFFADNQESVADDLLPETTSQLIKIEFDKHSNYTEIVVL